MKALILAGGFGTRLRPLTCSRPKQLLPLATTTLIGHILTQLHKSGITEIIIATGYGGEHLKDTLSEQTSSALTLHFSIEPNPLGTAGAIKYAEPFLQNEPRFLVLNGDIVSDIDYRQIIQFHHHHNPTATICLVQVDDPSRFGVVELASDGRIHSFIEKPAAGQSQSKLVNAGCYVLNASVFDVISPHQEASLEREIFPKLCQSTKVYGWEHSGFWVDTGTPSAFLKAHQALHADAPLIGKDTQIASSAVIGSDVSIGSRVQIGPKTQIRNSVIFDDVIVEEGVFIDQSIIGQGAHIGANLRLEGFVIVGDQAQLDAGARIPKGALVCPGCQVKKGETPPNCFARDYQSLSV
jgi:mannose-1-phosphate guanylyltransferase